MLIKAKVARSECEADRASDLEALFASREEAKPPNILATVAGLYKSESGSLSSHEEKENGPAFHQSEATLFLLTLFFSS